MSNKPILFCDFDGTICHDRYWRSLSADSLEKVQEFLFRNDKTIVEDWMRGKYTAEEINKMVAEEIGIAFESVWDVFVKDCETMRISEGALDKLCGLRDRYIVVLITGNMDSFTRFTQPALSLDQYFDHISNSYYEGQHKNDNEGETFMKYINKFEAPIAQSILLDNSGGPCKTFKKLGGISYLVTPEEDVSYHLDNLI